LRFGRRQAGSRRSAGVPDPRSSADGAEFLASPTLSKVLEKTFRIERPAILDLGPFCGETVVQLASRGARVQVEPFVPPPPTPPREPGKPREEPLVPLTIDQPDGKFDLVLVWEQIDFVPPDRLAEFGAELHRVLRDGGFLLAFSLAKKVEGRPMPARYRLAADGKVAREFPDRARRRRWVHPNREIERSLVGMSMQGIHLQRNQMREFFAVRKG